jgi:hypothetical protein
MGVVMGVRGFGTKVRRAGTPARVGVVAGVTAMLFAAAAPNAHAQGVTSLTCTGVNGTVYTAVGSGDVVTWTLQGAGNCADLFGNQFHVSLTGSASSHGDSYCTGDAPLANLVFAVSAKFTDAANTPVATQSQAWTVAVSTGTVVMPFAISGDTNGAGTVFTRIFAQCPGVPGSSPIATFDWAQTLPA